MSAVSLTTAPRQVLPPVDLAELKQRAAKLTGLTLFDLADKLGMQVPTQLKHAKGWIGQLLELALGATGGSKAIHDFPHLKIELKTIPLSKNLTPLESTYVCTAPLTMDCTSWEQSWVQQKLQHVLWVPILAEPNLDIADRKILKPFLWEPTPEQQETLRQDWEELTELLYMGNVEKLSAKYGSYLHIRPKAANSKVLVETYNEFAETIKTVPKGFYLRTTFTKQILANAIY